MKSIAFSAFLTVVLSVLPSLALATTSLSFDGGGYWLDLEIGGAAQPAVASIRFHRPGDSKGIVLRGNYVVRNFDTERRELIVVYEGQDPRVSPFTLSVRGEIAMLEIAATRITSAFSWVM